jgi:hypothetical protein
LPATLDAALRAGGAPPVGKCTGPGSEGAEGAAAAAAAVRRRPRRRAFSRVLELKTVEGHVRQVLSKLDLEPSSDDHRRVLAVLTYLKPR